MNLIWGISNKNSFEWKKMNEKQEMPDWYENYPHFADNKKKPVKITKDMEIVSTYGVDGYDIISKVFVSTDNITTSDCTCPPGGYLIPPGIHCNEEIYYVVQGEAVVTNPENGESVRVKEGNAIVIPRNTLHQVHNFGEKSLYVLCFIHKQWEEKEWQKLEKMVNENK